VDRAGGDAVPFRAQPVCSATRTVDSSSR
jgi:hypothetical protein